jgi:hypothetical protein
LTMWLFGLLHRQQPLGTPFKPGFDVQFHDILYKTSPDILYTSPRAQRAAASPDQLLLARPA